MRFPQKPSTKDGDSAVPSVLGVVTAAVMLSGRWPVHDVGHLPVQVPAWPILRLFVHVEPHLQPELRLGMFNLHQRPMLVRVPPPTQRVTLNT